MMSCPDAFVKYSYLDFVLLLARGHDDVVSPWERPAFGAAQTDYVAAKGRHV
ncbi:MAG: hypothetical protein ACYTDV_09970 [Planctomycetota bacterium]|jgi:hypothetical protein